MKMFSRGKRLILQGQDGFTLIELVLVIIIVIILGAVVSLGLSGLSSIRLDQAVNKVVGDLRYAQQLAISTQSRHGMTVDPAATGYSMHIHDGAVGTCGGETCMKDPINLGQDFIVNFDTYQQAQLAGVVFASATPFCGGANAVMEFNSIGAPTDTAGVLLACNSSLTLSYSGNNRTITIQQNTGNLTY